MSDALFMWGPICRVGGIDTVRGIGGIEDDGCGVEGCRHIDVWVVSDVSWGGAIGDRRNSDILDGLGGDLVTHRGRFMYIVRVGLILRRDRIETAAASALNGTALFAAGIVNCRQSKSHFSVRNRIREHAA